MYPYSTVCIKGNEFLDKGVSISICMAPTATQPSLGDAELLLQQNFLLLSNTFPWIILNSFPASAGGCYKNGDCMRKENGSVHITQTAAPSAPQEYSSPKVAAHRAIYFSEPASAAQRDGADQQLCFLLCFHDEKTRSAWQLRQTLCRVPAAPGLLYGAAGERAPKSNRKQYNPV